MMTRIKTDTLHEIPVFGDLEPDEVELIATAAVELHAGPGTTLLRQGESGHGMLVVLDGAVTVSRNGTRIAEVAAGGFVGETALLRHQTRNATVVAATDSTLMYISGPTFGALIDRFPEVGDRIRAASAVTAASPATSR